MVRPRHKAGVTAGLVAGLALKPIPLNPSTPSAFLNPSGGWRHTMRLLFLTLALLPAAAIAQDNTSPPPPDGVAVETIGLKPGEARTFVLRPGGHHQLLVPAAIDDPGAISVTYTDNGGKSAITVTSASGPMTYKVLSDPTGSGGYVDAGTFTMRGNGTATTETFNRDLGAIVVGEFRPAG